MLKSITIIVTISFALFSKATYAQKKFDETFVWMFWQVHGYHGNVFLDTVYKKYDSMELRKRYPATLSNELKLLGLYPAKLLDINFRNMPKDIMERAGSIGMLYSTRSQKQERSRMDSIALSKMEKFFLESTEAKDTLRNIEDLLLTSTFHRKTINENGTRLPKLMTVLSVFESDKYYLVIYNFTELISYPHYRVLSELILK